MKKINNYALISSFLSIIFLISIMTILRSGLNTSNLENRTLAEIPEFSSEDLFSGEYFKGWEEYLPDHIYGRNYWIGSYTFLNLFVLGKNNVNKIVIGEEGNLLPFIPYDSNNNLDYIDDKTNIMVENINMLDKHIKGYGGHFCFVGIPEQSSYLRDKYQSYYRNNEDFFDKSERAMFEKLTKNNISYINMNAEFKRNHQENFYLKTDHHYTFRGAHKVYTEIINKMINNFDFKIRQPLTEDEMVFITLPQPIKGSRNRLLSYLYNTDEKMEIAYPIEEITYTKTTNGNDDPEFYHISDNVEERPTYSIFMGGDHAETIIKTDGADLPNLLIFGDSFTNAIEPLLYYHFNETRILDLRYYEDMSLYEYIEKYRPDAVLMIRDDLNYFNLDGNGTFK